MVKKRKYVKCKKCGNSKVIIKDEVGFVCSNCGDIIIEHHNPKLWVELLKKTKELKNGKN